MLRNVLLAQKTKQKTKPEKQKTHDPMSARSKKQKQDGNVLLFLQAGSCVTANKAKDCVSSPTCYAGQPL